MLPPLQPPPSSKRGVPTVDLPPLALLPSQIFFCALPAPSCSCTGVIFHCIRNTMKIPTQTTTYRHQRQRQRLQIFSLAIISRVILLLAMSLSCAIVPDFHPGDDVLQFNLRLENTDSAAGDTCFCLQGHACDHSVKTRRRSTMINGNSCADDDNNIKQHIIGTKYRYDWLDQFYSFILPPITKWDAARFLTLSVDPWARYPPFPFIEQTTCNDDDTCDPITADEYNEALHKSEQAHAFLPLFPLIIRYTTTYLIIAIPGNFLPPTYEATIAFTAILVNMLAFAIAAVSLYDLTIFIAMRNDLAISKEDETNSDIICHCDNAKTTAELFCINPAGVFFTSAYSESVFAMFTFAGHAIAARGQYDNASSLITNTKSDRSSTWLASYYWVPTTLLWALASYVRSNGTFSSIWWMLIGIGKCCSYIYSAITATKRGSGSVCIRTIAVKCASVLFCHCILALAIAAPVVYHDKRGSRFHCMGSNDSLFNKKPEWCTQTDASANFSLYAHVQRKHWNVGLLRYYEIKQIPNFILAMPVLILSFGAAASWIAMSWNSHKNLFESECKGCKLLNNVFCWAFRALSSSSDSVKSEQFRNKHSSVSNSSQLLLGPSCLSYYAILAGFALVGLFVAHVQISTRLICSSCPALYWFVSALVTRDQQNDKDGDDTVREKHTTHAPALILFYCILFNVLGVIMHVNWLPWT
jgi:phosphatidylinositol glycan class V